MGTHNVSPLPKGTSTACSSSALVALAVTPTTGDQLRDTSTSFFLATLDTVLDNAWLVSNFGVIIGVLPLLGGALVLAGVVISFLALLPFLVLAGVSTLEESEGVLEFS